MKVRISKFQKDIKQYDKLVFWGAGFFAKTFSETIKEYNIAPDFYVISRNNEIKNIKNNIIYYFDECKEVLKDKKTCIIIAVSERYQYEIAEA